MTHLRGLIGLALALWFGAGSAAQPETPEQARQALEQSRLVREQAEQRKQQADADCASRVMVNRCRQQAAREHRSALELSKASELRARDVLREDRNQRRQAELHRERRLDGRLPPEDEDPIAATASQAQRQHAREDARRQAQDENDRRREAQRQARAQRSAEQAQRREERQKKPGTSSKEAEGSPAKAAADPPAKTTPD